MNPIFRFLALTIFMTLTAILPSCKEEESKREIIALPDAPIAEKKDSILTMHGHQRVDPYFWMRLTDEQKLAKEADEQTKKVVAYLEAENEYTERSMAHTSDLQEKIYEEILGRIKQTDESVPYKKNGYWYYTRNEEGKDYPIYCRKKGTMENAEEVMMDVNEMAVGYSYYQVSGLSVSPDNSMVAFGVDTLSRRQYTVMIKNLNTGLMEPTIIPNTTGGATWANDNKTLFYTKKDPKTLRSNTIYRHEMGNDPIQDELIFEEKDETFYTGIYKSKSEQYLIIWSGSTLTNYYQILNANNPGGRFMEFSPRERGLEYDIEHFEDKFYIVTNWDAQNFRLMETAAGKTHKENWVEVIPHRKDVFLQDIEVFKNYLVLEERKNGLRQVRVMEQGSDKEHYLDFGEEAYAAYLTTNVDFNTNILRYYYTSLTTPGTTYDYNMDTREKILLKRQEVLGGYDPEDYQTERLMVKAADGTLVPISIIYKKGLKKNGKNPTLLYGYGSYGATMEPTFSSLRLSLVDRGFIYAIAHIRGGQTMGRQWYEDGKMFKKKNTFTDFNDCARHLINEKYTRPEQLYAMGGSAGGLLMGAIINLEPELYNGIVAQVPFVDVISTMLDESIPLTTGEFDEWGNPKNKDSYDYMLSYSPYDNVQAMDYPHMLVTTGYHDSQVQYWEPAKWVAKLRDMKTDNNRLLLKTEMEFGHGGASGRYQQYREIAIDYAFILDLEGITE